MNHIHAYQTDIFNYLKIAEENICRAERFQQAKEKSLQKCKDLLKILKFNLSPQRKYELVIIYKDDLEKIKPHNTLGDYMLKFIIERAQNETGIKRLSAKRAEEIVNSIAI